MKQDVGKVIDHMTQESCIPTDSVKSGDDYSSLVHNIRTVSYTHLRAHETGRNLVCRLLLEKKGVYEEDCWKGG